MTAPIPFRWPWAAAVAFVGLLLLTILGWPPLDVLDRAVSDALRRTGVARPGLVAFVRVATDIAATVPFLAAGCVATTILAVRRHRRPALFTAAVTTTIPALWALMHLALSHPRPLDAFVVVHSNGFPSGHTTNAAAAALTAVLLLWPRLTRRARFVAVAAGLMFALLVGLTRLILLAHWPSDVLGGWLLAAAAVPALARLTMGADRSAGVSR